MSAETLSSRLEDGAGRWVVALDGEGCNVGAVGGKAAGLDRLASHGFPIPRSVAVTTGTYRRFVAATGLEDWLADLAACPEPAPQELADAADAVDTHFARAPMPADLAAAIGFAARGLLEHGPVAVRSSASAEDLGVASFAGQYRSFVNVDSLRDVMVSVKRCWASLWSPAVRAYRLRNAIPTDGLAMGVVIQSMVAADWSGVAFTADPERRTTGVRIEVVPGLGEALVSGRVTPDDYLVDRTTLEIVSTTAGEPPDFLEDLARMLLLVEYCLDAPQDVEWSTVDGEITLLQARPITVAGPTTAEDDGFDGPVGIVDTYTPRGVVEMLPDVVPPLLWTINAPMIENAFQSVVASLGSAQAGGRHRFVGRFRGRAALNLTALENVAAATPGGSVAEVQRQFLGRPLGEDVPSEPAHGFARLVGALRTRRAQRRLADEIDLTEAAVAGLVRLDVDVGSLPVRRLLAYRCAVRDIAWRLAAAEVAASSAAAAAYRALELLLARWVEADDASRWAQRLTTGSVVDFAGLAASRRLGALYASASARHPGLRSALVARPLERAPERIRQLGRPGREFASHVEWIVRSQGCRSIYAGVTWAEDSSWAWEQLSVAASRSSNPRSSSCASPLDELIATLGTGRRWRLLRILTGQVVDLRLRWLRRQAAEASRFLALRERAKGVLLMLGGEERRIVLDGARRLHGSRQLRRAEDVELLGDGEFASMLVGAPPPSEAELSRRRSVLDRCRRGERLPETFAGAPGAPPLADSSAGATMHGWAASPGRVEGEVKVVADLADGAKLRRGDVLVAHATDPSWTPLLLVAGGLVLEEGGPLSHGAIVAREFGLPAVLNVPGAARLLCDGEVVQVDGYHGCVRRRVGEDAA